MVSSAVTGAVAVRNTSSGTASKSSNTKSKSSDFKSVMAASISKNTSNAGTGSSDSKLGIADDVKSAKDQNTTDTKNTKADTDAVDKKQNAADTGKADKTDKSKQDNKSDEKVNDAVQNVKDTIKEELDVSDEDIAKAMEVLGITDNDLLSVVKVTELVSALTGADSITLITDDDMSGKLTSVLDAVNTAQEDIADMLNTDVDDAVLVVRTDAVVKKDTDATVVKNTDSSITDNQSVSETESLSDVLAAKVTAQGSSKHEESTGEHTGEQNHNTQSYGGVADSIIQSMKDSFADIVTEDTSRVSEADIVNQVIDQIKLSSGRELTSIEVMLNPERLGSVHVTVTAKNGILSAQIAAQNEQVKTALENQVTALKENFQNQGIKVEAVEITVMTHQFEAGQNFGQNESERKQSEQKINKKLNLSDYMDDEDETVSAQDIRRKDSIQNGNSSVEYMA
ncbi:MAG: flagellar hook-length control protein FliK [Lachnospira sp.]|uniref:flagellar hook-length control protein FliK n=1 Tax=Lachnospira sp. TaxID=2049031 RepID=UPI003A2097F4